MTASDCRYSGGKCATRTSTLILDFFTEFMIFLISVEFIFIISLHLPAANFTFGMHPKIKIFIIAINCHCLFHPMLIVPFRDHNLFFSLKRFYFYSILLDGNCVLFYFVKSVFCLIQPFGN